ncbi:MAG TPA: hypothetical protein VJA22_00715 [Patescibacteria group bacterium]|nr:hypothetical protein [Patescibacteria group bacterium]
MKLGEWNHVVVNLERESYVEEVEWYSVAFSSVSRSPHGMQCDIRNLSEKVMHFRLVSGKDICEEEKQHVVSITPEGSAHVTFLACGILEYASCFTEPGDQHKRFIVY